MTPDTELYSVGGPTVAWRETGSEIVVLDLTGAVYFGLNGTGAQLWKQLINGATSADLMRQLSPQSANSDAQLETEIAQFLADLDHFGLLHRSPC